MNALKTGEYCAALIDARRVLAKEGKISSVEVTEMVPNSADDVDRTG